MFFTHLPAGTSLASSCCRSRAFAPAIDLEVPAAAVSPSSAALSLSAEASSVFGLACGSGKMRVFVSRVHCKDKENQYEQLLRFPLPRCGIRNSRRQQIDVLQETRLCSQQSDWARRAVAVAAVTLGKLRGEARHKRLHPMKMVERRQISALMSASFTFPQHVQRFQHFSFYLRGQALAADVRGDRLQRTQSARAARVGLETAPCLLGRVLPLAQDKRHSSQRPPQQLATTAGFVLS